MAKKPSKADQRRKAASNLTEGTFRGFIGTVRSVRQELDDATMAHASEWKKADNLGIHPDAAKLHIKLDKMEETKRNDFLRAFDLYRDWSNWDAQPDMFEEARPPVTFRDVTGERDEDEDFGSDVDEAEESLAAAEQQDEGEGVPAAVTGPEADWDPLAAADDEDLDNAGFAFNAGRIAADDGFAPSFNPYEDGTAHARMWEMGRAKRAAEIANQASEEASETEASDAQADQSDDQDAELVQADESLTDEAEPVDTGSVVVSLNAPKRRNRKAEADAEAVTVPPGAIPTDAAGSAATL